MVVGYVGVVGGGDEVGDEGGSEGYCSDAGDGVVCVEEVVVLEVVVVLGEEGFGVEVIWWCVVG